MTPCFFLFAYPLIPTRELRVILTPWEAVILKKLTVI